MVDCYPVNRLDPAYRVLLGESLNDETLILTGFVRIPS
jgi:hypothetical protein